MSLRQPLARVRGLGSSGSGTRTFWHQRVTAVMLVLLCLWFVTQIVSLAGADWAHFQAWISRPWNSGLLAATLVVAFYHGQIGLQVIIEDYIAGEGAKIAAIIAVRILAVALGAVSLAAVAKAALMGV